MRTLLAALAALVLTGCNDLETSYGTLGFKSVNGGDVLTAAWKRDFTARPVTRPSARLDDCDLVLHLARERGVPDEAACTWIQSWLEQGEKRQAVLVLRDGAPGTWLCQHWADECDAAAKADPARAPELGQEAARLRFAAGAQDDGGTDRGERIGCELFAVRAIEPVTPQRLSGALDDEAPPTLCLRSEPADAEEAETIVAADGHPLAWSLPVGHGRLVVVANATALLDGALVHPAARHLLDALEADIRAHRAAHPGAAAVLRRLTPRDGDDQPPPNQLAMLFARLPYAWASWHFLVLTVVALLARAAWLGRVAPGRGRPLERFARHVDALAWHLRGRDAWRGSLDALARLHKSDPPAAVDAASARAAVAALFPPAHAGTHPAPAPTGAEQEP